MKRLRPEFLGFDSIEVVKVPAPDKLTDPEMKQIVDAVEKARAKIEQPQDYTQDADDVMLIQYCLALGMQDLLKREAMYSNGGGWALGRVHADIARCHKLQDDVPRYFDEIKRLRDEVDLWKDRCMAAEQAHDATIEHYEQLTNRNW